MKKRVYLALFLVAVLSPALFAGWSQMQRLTYRGNEIAPQVVARHDTVHVIWNQAGGVVSYIRSTDNGVTWDSLIDLTEPGHEGVYINLAITANAVWVGWSDNNGAIGLRSSTNGSNWDTPIYKYTVDSQRYTFPCMAVSGDTVFISYMSFIDDSTGLSPYKFLKSTDGGHSWSNLVTIGHVPQNASAQWQVMSYCGGNLLFACAVDIDSLGYGPHIIGYVSNDKGIHWTEPMLVSPALQYWAQWPCVSCNKITGQFAVGYMDYRYQQYAFYGDIFIRLSETDPNQWGLEAQATDEHTSKYPSVSFRGNTLMVVWSDRKYHSTGDDEIFFNSSSDGGVNWSGLQRLTNTYSQSIYPQLYDNDGTIHVTWYEHDTSGGYGSDIFYIKYTPDSTDIVNDETIKPSTFTLSAYPNPFNSTLSININSEEAGEIYISDILGRFVTALKFPKGTSTIKWDASDKNGKTLPSGAYFIKQKGGSYKDIIKVMYLK
jgi:hypothetical protein